MQIDRKEPIPGESPGAGGEAMKLPAGAVSI